MAMELAREGFFDHIDLIIPIPIHSKKKKIRGYNQAELIANGISNKTTLEVRTDVLIKSIKTESQTKKSRMLRFENVRSSFRVQKADEIVNSHILLVDDVITTGATIEACGICLKEQIDCKLSALSIAATV